jgi:radical SAM protein with 4Fe4S-binding SPASM domain
MIHGNNILQRTSRFSIELSNLCNLSIFHKKCPLHGVKEPKILSEKIVFQILNICKKYNFEGTIAYHTYNEPGIDPRLMLFINKARELLPKVEILLQTNGFYLDQNLAEEYVNHGTNIIRVSAYTGSEYERLRKIKLPISYEVIRTVLDDRLQEDIRPEINCTKPCYAPLNEILVTNRGDISLCCLDWKREHVFGNLYRQKLEEILMTEKLLVTYNNLSRGRRFLSICKKCNWTR